MTVDAMLRAVDDLTKRMNRAEADIERMKAERQRPTPEELVNQTVPRRKELPPHYSVGEPL